MYVHVVRLETVGTFCNKAYL